MKVIKYCSQSFFPGKICFAALILAGLAALYQPVIAQRNEIGVAFGGAFYMGDLNPKLPMVLINPGGGAFYRLNFNQHWSARANVYYLKVEGNDAYVGYNPERNLSFFSNIYEFSMQSEVNFLQYQAGNLNTPFTPFLFAGLGGFMFHPKRLMPGGEIIDLTNRDQRFAYGLHDKETDYGLVSYSLLFGVGFKFNITRFVSTGVEWGMRRTGTDYLDDISYGNPPSPTSSPPYFIGNPKNNDWYSFFGLTLSVKINDPSRVPCPYPD
jgi:hypothetical protein